MSSTESMPARRSMRQAYRKAASTPWLYSPPPGAPPTLETTLLSNPANLPTDFDPVAWLQANGVTGYTTSLEAHPSNDRDKRLYTITAHLAGLSSPVTVPVPSRKANAPDTSWSPTSLAAAVRAGAWKHLSHASSSAAATALAPPFKARSGRVIKDSLALSRFVKFLWEHGWVRRVARVADPAIGSYNADLIPPHTMHGWIPQMAPGQWCDLRLWYTGQWCDLRLWYTGQFLQPLLPLKNYGGKKQQVEQVPRWPFRVPTQAELADKEYEGVGTLVFLTEQELGVVEGLDGAKSMVKGLRVDRFEDLELGALGSITIGARGGKDEVREVLSVGVDLGWALDEETLWGCS